MKVLHLIDSLGYGGAERLLVDLVPRLQERGADSVVVSVSAVMPLGWHLKKIGIPVTSIEFEGTIYSLMRLRRAAITLNNIICSQDIQIVHSHLYTSDILARISTPFHCKLINTLHSRDPWWYERTRLRSIGKTLLDMISHRARGVRSIAVSEDAANEAMSALHIDARAIWKISNGINTARFVASRGGRKLRTIIQVARFYPVKGHDIALSAFVSLLAEYPDLQLVWVGDGPDKAALRRKVKRLGIDSSVQFLGVLDDVAEQLAEADIFWMPSRWEGMPIACIEAMATGLPVIASNVGGIPEVVLDGETGLLIEPGSDMQLAAATRRLLEKPGLALEFGSAGRARAKKCFSIDATADHYIRVYSDILDSA